MTAGRSRSSDGVTLADTRHCWGVGAPGNACEGKALGAAVHVAGRRCDPLWQVENACYLDPVKPTQTSRRGA